ncbi:hypothetical protein K6T13_03235 [Nocardioides coralli]|nr:hypothetical protein K6T13_03235 [Nocardioides coralli]
MVLAALALRVGEAVSSEQLAEALWRDRLPATWPKALQTAIVQIRKTLGPGAVETVGHAYRLALPRGEVDAREFERLVARARELLTQGEPDRATYLLDQALAMWRGEALVELSDWEPGRQEADRLGELRRDAEELRVDAALRDGRHGDVLVDARRLVEQAPLRERRWELLALAQYRSGQQADALRTLHQLRRTLVEELGIDPGPDAIELETRILRQDPDLQPEEATPTAARACPYLGLVPYDIADSDAFFGREKDVAACRRRLADTGVVAVVGPSGSGKSSLVRAGVAAALRADGERVVVITPGRRPLDALSAVPRDPRVVLIVDQAEEAVMAPDDPAQVEQFFAALTLHAAGGRLVVALRADRFGDLAAYAVFARLVEQGLFVLTPMSGDALRDAIEGPAQLAGLRLDAGLVELLVAEVEGQPGALPHLSHALRQTWERREGGVLTIDGYRSTGGIRDAVARSAERVYEELSSDQRVMLRDVMLRLVSPGPDGEPVRSRVPRRLLTADPEHDRMMERLVAARLVSSDDEAVELAHEALARSWPRLQGWLDEDTEGQRILRHLAIAADTWDSMGRPDDELYRGNRLAAALEWRDRTEPDLTPVEADFLDAGSRRHRAEKRSLLEQTARQARTNRRLRALLGVAALLLLVSAVTGTLAIGQANRAADVTRTADARRVAAQAQLAAGVDRSLALAAAAFGAEPSTESQAGLLAALTRFPELVAVRPVPGAWSGSSPDGSVAALMDYNHQVRFLDTETLRQLGQYDPYPGLAVQAVAGNVSPLAFSGNGSTMAVGVLTIEDEVVRLLDSATYAEARRQPGGQPPWAYPTDVQLSSDGRQLAVSVGVVQGPQQGENLIYLWDLARPARPSQVISLPGDTFFVAFSPDGRRLHASPGWNSDAPPGRWTWSTRTGELLGTSPDGGQGLSINQAGTLLGYAQGSTVVLVDEDTGEIEERLRGPQGQVRQVAFSPDGRTVAAIADDPAVFVWEVLTGDLLEEIVLEDQGHDVGFDLASDRLLVPNGSRLDVFGLTGLERYVARVRRGTPGTAGDFRVTRYGSPYEPVVATSSYEPARGASVLDIRSRVTEQPVAELGLSWAGNTFEPAWSPDNEHLAFVDSRDRLRVWNWREEELVTTRTFRASQLAYDEDGRRIFAVTPRGLVLLDAQDLLPVGSPIQLTNRVTDAALGAGDETAVLITAEPNNSAFGYTVTDRWRVVDLETGQTVRSGSLRQPGTALVLSPDRSRMAVSGPAGVEIVDLATAASTVSQDRTGAAEAEGQLPTFSPDGRLIATADGMGSVSLWDGRTAELLGTVQPGDSQVQPLFLDADTLFLQYSDGAAYIWRTSPEHALRTACRILDGGLDPTEWQEWFGERPYVDVCA